MKKAYLKLSAAALSVALYTAPAFAASEQGAYAGVMLTRVTVSYNGTSSFLPNDNYNILVGKLGYQYNRNFAIELRGGFGLGDSSNSVQTNLGLYSYTSKIDNVFGVYAIAQAELADHFSAYALAGGTRVNGSSSGTIGTTPFSVTSSDSGFSFGAGLRYTLSGSQRITLEYTSFLRGSNYDATGLSLGIETRF